ncbi:MAG: ketopantoate reductase family protein [Thermoplasmatota archaeon]
MPDVLVAGAGAIGQWLGLRLLQAGHQVCLLTRPDVAQSVRASGLWVEGFTQAHGHPTCITKPSEVRGPFASIVLTCKAHATEELALQVAPLLAPDGVLLSLQNGFGNGSKAAFAVGAPRVAVATTSHGVDVTSPGRIRHAGVGDTHVGPLAPGSGPAARRAWDLLYAAGLDPGWHESMQEAVWTKGLLNHAVNPVAALGGVTNGALLFAPLTGEAHGLLDEGVALSRAAGIPLPPALGSALDSLLERTGANRCSMLQDVARGRPTEVEQISGWLCRLGRRLGYPMPKSEAIYRRVKEREAGYLGEERALALTRQEAAAPVGTF